MLTIHVYIRRIGRQLARFRERKKTGMLSHEMIYAKSVIYYQNKHREDYVPGRRRDEIVARKPENRTVAIVVGFICRCCHRLNFLLVWDIISSKLQPWGFQVRNAEKSMASNKSNTFPYALFSECFIFISQGERWFKGGHISFRTIEKPLVEPKIDLFWL